MLVDAEVIRNWAKLLIANAEIDERANGTAGAHVAATQAGVARSLLALIDSMPAPPFIDVVFDGPPGPEAGRFVEVENPEGHSVNAGEWIDRGNGLWALRIPRPAP